MTRFAPDVVAAVLHHMNTDHAEDNLVIVRAFGQRAAESARMVGVDGEAGEWRAVVEGREVPVRIAWAEPVTERPDIRRAVVELYDRACEQLGLPARDPH